MKNKFFILALALILLVGVVGSVEARIFEIYNTSNPSQTFFTVDGPSGKVGIGTASPGVALDIRSASTSVLEWGNLTTTLGRLAYNGADAQIYAGSSGKLSLGSNNAADKLVIDTSGRVGIGPTSPTYPLDVESSGETLASFVSTDDTGRILVSDDNTENYIVSKDGYFSLGGNNGLSSSNLVIGTSTGYVGIGTASPATQLDVGGRVRSNSSQVTYTGTGADPSISLGGDADSGIYGGSGGVGISSNSHVGFFVNGSGVITSLGDITADLDIRSSGDNTISYGASYSDPHVGTSYDMKFGGSGGGIAVYGDSVFRNNVGIGTTTPSNRLVVGDDTVNLADTSLVVGNSNGNSYLQLGDAQTSKGYIQWNYAGNYLSLSTVNGIDNYADTLALKDGKVGIGNVTPTYYLEVASGAVAGNGAYVNLASHSSKKENFTSVAVLDRIMNLTIYEWQYKEKYQMGDPYRHLYPFADDFYKNFGLGKDEWRITSEDIAGVAIKGVQEVNAKVLAQQQIILSQNATIQKLQTRVDTMSATINRICANSPELC